MTTENLTAEKKAAIVDVGVQLSDHLHAIAKLFKPHMKLTLLVRDPAHSGHNAYLSDEDDIEPVVEALRQLHKNPRGGSFMV